VGSYWNTRSPKKWYFIYIDKFCPPMGIFLQVLPMSVLHYILKQFSLVETLTDANFTKRSLNYAFIQGNFIYWKNYQFTSFWRIPISDWHQSRQTYILLILISTKISHQLVLGYCSVSEVALIIKTLCFLGRLMWLKKSFCEPFTRLRFAGKKTIHPCLANPHFPMTSIRQNKNLNDTI